MREGHKGANPLVGQRVADEDVLQPPGTSSLSIGDSHPKTATRLEIDKILVAAAKSRGPKTRPKDLGVK